MKHIHIAALLAAVALCGQAMASEAIIKKARCVACHAVEKKLVGPAFKDVGAKYAGEAGALEKLTAKVRAGGSGVWGEIPMTP
ncbi:MAG: cytochrome C biogenesis protein CcsA, partial [Zoogloea sp.]|nr:cytochrome C biogenesis protein CcsA [Zoogloea sp.]